MGFSRFGLMLIAISLNAVGQGSAEPQTLAASDDNSRAVQIAALALSKAGGSSALQALQDMSETGVIHYGATLSGSASVQTVGTSEIRLDAELPNNRHTWFTSQGQGKFRDSKGIEHAIPAESGANTGALTLPALKLAEVLRNPSFKLSYLGIETSGANRLYRLHVEDTSGSTEPEKRIARARTCDYFIDADSLRVVRLEDHPHSADNYADLSLPRSIEFSDYRSVDGIEVPYHIVERVNGAETWFLDVSEVKFNTGLSHQDIGF